ncbi:MAG: hypothetical protein RI538_04050 [Salibaculum sp.]|jgi:hypothetical protein|uniref:hypothetical protein n=2 Tax=Roseobacteraceae TaxID=2854170 RepID=UPI00286FBC67|nr:hypothetical protein [Salibaculum sp.]MDR9427060.1 hypothetical protein [Salibaculum sp.]MDR9481941.1 hypothetical protein [Salibaculum sp.]
MSRRAHIALVYLLAYVAGVGTAFAVMRVQAGAGPMPPGPWLLAAPVAGLAAFATVFGLGRGRALRAVFWTLALLGLAALWLLAVLLIRLGVAPVPVLGIIVIALLPSGMALALRDGGR